MFITPLNCQKHHDREHYYRISGNDLVWLTITLYLKIVMGFITDFASIPEFLWNILAPRGRHSRAAALHDFIYATGAVSRLTGERLFWEAMTLDRVTLWKKVVMVSFTMMFGWYVWNRWGRLRRTDPVQWSVLTGLPVDWAKQLPDTVFKKLG